MIKAYLTRINTCLTTEEAIGKGKLPKDDCIVLTFLSSDGKTQMVSTFTEAGLKELLEELHK